MKKKRVNFYIGEDEKMMLDEKAKKLNISFSTIIRKLIKEYLSKDKLQEDNKDKKGE